MHFGNVELHNVCVAEPFGNGGVYLRRFPASVRSVLKNASLERANNSSGCEVRFISDCDEVYVTLMSKDRNSFIYTYCGDYLCERIELSANEKTTVCIKQPENYGKVDLSLIKKRFSPLVYRVFISCSCECVFFEASDAINSVRPPKAEHLPYVRWFAYGSSITQGIWSIVSCDSYIHHAAKRLGVDVFCKGMSGTCFCENEMMDYLAKPDNWDFITMEIGVNMYEMPLEEFKDRVSYGIEKVCSENKGKPIFVITPFPNIFSFGNDEKFRSKHCEFTEFLLRFNGSGVKVIDGAKILDDYTYLSHDLLHPTDYGHMCMGENLAATLREELEYIKE